MSFSPESGPKLPGANSTNNTQENVVTVSQEEYDEMSELIQRGIDSVEGFTRPQNDSEKKALDEWIKRVKELIGKGEAHEVEFFYLAFNGSFGTNQIKGWPSISYLAERLSMSNKQVGAIVEKILDTVNIKEESREAKKY